MHFFIDADLPRDVASVITEGGHQCTDCRDVGLASATDSVIIDHARTHNMVLITGDYAFANIQTYPPSAHSGIVALAIPRGVGRPYILQLVREFLDAIKSETSLAGKLFMVEPGRIRTRRNP